MTLSDSGGRVEYDCARGVVSEPIRIDSRGVFDVAGFHFRGHGGPVRLNEPVDSVPARYTGSVRGEVMNLDVRLAAATLGTFRLVKGGEALIFRCL